MDPLARLMEGAPLPGVLGATRDVRPRGALVHASLAAAPSLGDKKGRHLTGTFCLTGDTMEGIIQCLVFLKAFSVSFSNCALQYQSALYNQANRGPITRSLIDYAILSTLKYLYFFNFYCSAALV